MPGCCDRAAVALLFGLSKSNAEDDTKTGAHDRVPRIRLSFAKSLAKAGVDKSQNPVGLIHYRTEARMPGFDGKGELLPDTQRIPGFGNIIFYVKDGCHE